MGSDFSKGKSYREAEKFGQIFLQTDKATYFGGETVTGRIYLNLLLPYSGNQIFLKLKGKESVHFVIQRQETVNRGNQTVTRIIEDLFQERSDMIKIIVPIHSWGGTLMPGQFALPFSFMLPANLPSTFHQEGHRHLANISYRLEAILEPSSKHEPRLKFKQNFVVRTPVKNAAENHASEIRTELTTCCCCKQGSNVLRVNFEKNYYAPGEIAQVMMQLDNGQSKIDNTRLCFALKQKLVLTACGRTFQRNPTKAQNDRHGIQAGGASDSKQIGFNLPLFQEGDYKSVKNFNMIRHLINLRDNNANLNSATKSRLITSEYYLEAFCPMKGCCSNTPRLAIPIEIYYPEFQLLQVQQPDNWAPQVIEAVTVSFAAPMGAPVQMMAAPIMQQPSMAPNMVYGNDMYQGQNYGQVNQGQNYDGMYPGYGGNQQQSQHQMLEPMKIMISNTPK